MTFWMYWTNTSFQQLTLASPRFSITKCKCCHARRGLHVGAGIDNKSTVATNGCFSAQWRMVISSWKRAVQLCVMNIPFCLLLGCWWQTGALGQCRTRCSELLRSCCADLKCTNHFLWGNTGSPVWAVIVQSWSVFKWSLLFEVSLLLQV